MTKYDKNSKALVEHFFRTEYGKIVAVIAKYLGMDRIETAEDIVQETLLTAVEYWQHKGIPPNPHAWLYATAKNKTLNFLRRQKLEKEVALSQREIHIEELDFSAEQISDELLNMMLRCCHPSISNETQIALMLKILCGFSISEISSAFCTQSETINKRLVRGRKKLRENGRSMEKSNGLTGSWDVLLTTLYLLFTEGYSPAQKNQIIRLDLCLEAIRLAEILVPQATTSNKQNTHSLLALMYLNASRFEARQGQQGEVIEMELQDRTRWNQDLINKGLYHLNEAQEAKSISKYLILASISANHCIAPNVQATNWQEILDLYDVLLSLENSPMVQLNRIIALAKVNGPAVAILELKKWESLKDMQENYLYHSTFATLLLQSNMRNEAIEHFEKAILCCTNDRDKKFLAKKLAGLVPFSDSHV